MDRIKQAASNVKQKTSSLATSVSRFFVKPKLNNENNVRPIYCINELNDESSQGSHHSHTSFVDINKEDVTQSMNSETPDAHIKYEKGFNADNNVSDQADNHGMFGVKLSDLKQKSKKPQPKKS